jgi:hypothetical protein
MKYNPKGLFDSRKGTLLFFIFMSNKPICLSTNNSNAQSTSAHETRTRGAADRLPKTKKKTSVVTVTFYAPFAYHVLYRTLEGLCASVHKLLCEFFFHSDYVTVTLDAEDGGGTYKWNDSLADACFAMGLITTVQLATYTFNEKKEVAL